MQLTNSTAGMGDDDDGAVPLVGQCLTSSFRLLYQQAAAAAPIMLAPSRTFVNLLELGSCKKGASTLVLMPLTPLPQGQNDS